MESNVSIGNLIIEKRKQKNLTQEQLAGLLMISTKEIIKWESNQLIPPVSKFDKLNTLLGVDLSVHLNNNQNRPSIPFTIIDLSNITKVKDLIKVGRTNKGLSVEDMASLLNVSKQAVENWENGYVVPTIKVAETIANLLKIDFQLFYKDNNFLLGKPDAIFIPNLDSKLSKENDNTSTQALLFTPPLIIREREYLLNKIVKEERNSPHLTQTLTSSQSREFFNTLSIVSDETLLIMDIVKPRIRILDSKGEGFATTSRSTDANNGVYNLDYLISYNFDGLYPSDIYNGYRWAASVYFHEFGHAIDFALNWESSIYLSKIYPRITNLAEKLDSQIEKSGMPYKLYLSKLLKISNDRKKGHAEQEWYAFIADIMGSYKPEKYGKIRDELGIFGHSEDYYHITNQNYLELMAELFLDYSLNITESLEIKRKWLGDDIIILYKRYLNEFISRNLVQWRIDNKEFLINNK